MSVRERGKAPGSCSATSTAASAAAERGEIERVIKRHLAPARCCCERALQREPNAGAKVVMSFTVGSRGLVERATASGSAPQEMRGCVARVFERMRFPTPRGGGTVAVSYPLVFSQAGSAP